MCPVACYTSEFPRAFAFSSCESFGVASLAGVAQLVEQLIRNQQVTRSSRVAGSNNINIGSYLQNL